MKGEALSPGNLSGPSGRLDVRERQPGYRPPDFSVDAGPDWAPSFVALAARWSSMETTRPSRVSIFPGGTRTEPSRGSQLSDVGRSVFAGPLVGALGSADTAELEAIEEMAITWQRRSEIFIEWVSPLTISPRFRKRPAKRVRHKQSPELRMGADGLLGACMLAHPPPRCRAMDKL